MYQGMNTSIQRLGSFESESQIAALGGLGQPVVAYYKNTPKHNPFLQGLGQPVVAPFDNAKSNPFLWGAAGLLHGLGQPVVAIFDNNSNSNPFLHGLGQTSDSSMSATTIVVGLLVLVGLGLAANHYVVPRIKPYVKEVVAKISKKSRRK